MKPTFCALRTSVLASAILAGCLLLAGHSQAADDPDQGAPRIGLGQDAAKEPPMLRNLRLTDPLVRQKYLNEPDMLRFLRGTYSEACARGILVKAATQIKLDPQRKYDPRLRDAFKQLLDSQRIWKMASFELEAVFGKSYLKSANYCDCLLKEVTDSDLVNPHKGLEVINSIPSTVQGSCDQIATEKTERQMSWVEQKE